jgi:hypothetical protein
LILINAAGLILVEALMTEPITETIEARDRFPWAGPALFFIVLVLIAWFFWWFVQA